MGVATRILSHDLNSFAWLFHVVCRHAWMFFIRVITVTVTTSHFTKILTLRRQGRPSQSSLRLFVTFSFQLWTVLVSVLLNLQYNVLLKQIVVWQ